MTHYEQHQSTLTAKSTYVEGIPIDNNTLYHHHDNISQCGRGSCGSTVATTSTTGSPHHIQRKPRVDMNGQRRPVQLTFCPTCEAKNVRTRTRSHPNGATWIAVGVTAIVFWPVCWVPLVMDSMKQTDHYCQSCGQKVGKVKPMAGLGVKERQ